MRLKVMSDWEVDGITDNAWSSLDEVAWIDCEGKVDHIVPDPAVLKGTSFLPITSFSKAAGESSQGAHKTPEQICQRLQKLDHGDEANEGTCVAFESRELGYESRKGVISSSNNVWCDYQTGNSLTVVPSNSLIRYDSVVKGEDEPKEETPRHGLEGSVGMCKGSLNNHDEGSGVRSNSCNYLLSEICPPGGDLELFTESHEEGRRDNLLEYGWGNTNSLEDMDKLFTGPGLILSRGFDNSDDGMLWEPPSPTLGDNLDSIHQSLPVPVSLEFVTTGATKRFETNSDLSPIKNMVALKQDESPSADEWAVPKGDITAKPEASCLLVEMGRFTESTKTGTRENQGPNEGCSRASENMDDEASYVPKETGKGKTSKARRQGHRSKRLDENSRKPLSGRRLGITLAQAKKSSIMYVPVASISQDSPPCSNPSSQVTLVSPCETINPMQCLPPVPYVHAGFGFSSHHHLPVVVSSPSIMTQQLQPQGQPVFISYQQSPFIEVPKLQQSKSSFDGYSQSPTASSPMTPQEKIEKLRWRQKMQARLAVEQQQQQLISQRLIPDQSQFGRLHNHKIHPQPDTSEEVLNGSLGSVCSQRAELLPCSERPAMIEDGDESLAASVLHQLLNIASKMDTRTRLCLRDGFHRLAGNAMQRRGSGDIQGRDTNAIKRSRMAESSSNSEQSRSERLLTVDDIVETETNPMDRFIAHLLFHKRFPSSLVPLYTSHISCSVSEDSEPTLSNQTRWPCNEANTLSHPLPGTGNCSAYLESSIGRSKTLEQPVSDTICNTATNRSALSSIVSGLQLEKILKFSGSPADVSLQHLAAERESDMADMTTDLRAVVKTSGSMESFGKVEEPSLQA